ncbi:Cna B-type domain-containing protein [Corynebacterium spheniscorum]|uniref:CNA-B domain-containing protein n=1 Tax=Corynebacterium spheniscorum TaxID=185761 RepID=A0A1I2SW89_9CORY|nr:Cna B-type domain-containing protein [Corynebacterium spheniscorum]SFG56994.1 hypothetical protein SAMN05660282_01280 [Corynebacterium spheniscorum]
MTTTRRRATYLIMALLLIFSPLMGVTAQATPVNSEENLRELIAAAGTEPTTIELEGTLEITEAITIPAGADITFIPAGPGDATLQSGANSSGVVVRVEEGAALSLDPSTDGGKVIISAHQSATRVLDVAGEVTMNDGLLTGLKASGWSPSAIRLPEENRSVHGTGAVTVYGKGIMTMNGGAITENDINGKSSTEAFPANLAVAEGGTFILNGGDIRDGKAPMDWTPFSTGGVGLFEGATFTMNGGRITNNRGGASGGIMINNGDIYRDGEINGADREEDRAYWNALPLVNLQINGGEISENYGNMYGGGIGGFGKFAIEMNDGSIHDNEARFYGGGVLVDDYFVDGASDSNGVPVPGKTSPGLGQSLGYSIEEWREIVHASFEMNGGKISNNTAGFAGGGINANSDGVLLKAGEISDNTVPDNPIGMGGGVYATVQPYTLRMQNVLFENNYAPHGGGLWNCPTGQTTIHLEDGATFIGNTTIEGGDGRDFEIFPFGHEAEKPPVYLRLANRMLGGEGVKWYVDGFDSPFFVDQFDPENPGEPVDIDDLNANPRYVGLAAVGAAEGAPAREFARLIIRNNKATGGFGGGVGSNTNVEIGTGDNPGNLKVKKEWVNKRPIPGGLTIRLLANETPIDEVELTAENNWEHTFEGLPTYSNGKLIEYTIDEKDVPAGWSGNILDPITFERTADDKDPTVVERHLTLVNIDLTEVTGTKVWADEQAEHPDIQLQLFRKIDDGEAEPVGEPQLLDNGATTYTWSNLPVGDAEGNLYTYFVEEVATPEGYEKTTSDDGLTITNSPTSTPETSTPVTTPETSTPVTTPETSTPVTTPETSTPVTTPVTTPETSTPVTTPETSTPVTTPVTTPETSTPVTTPETSTPVTTPENDDHSGNDYSGDASE